MHASVFRSNALKLSALALAAASLVACGGGDPAPAVATDLPAVTVSAANATAASAVASLLVGSSVTLPALTDKNGVSIANGSKLEFTAKDAAAPATALSGFKLTEGAKVSTGYLIPGSCIFRVTSINGQPASSTLDIVFDPCAIDLKSDGIVANDAAQSTTVKLTLGSTPVSVPVTVVAVLENNKVVLKTPSGGTVTVGVATGS